jgi:hypothetical protein
MSIKHHTNHSTTLILTLSDFGQMPDDFQSKNYLVHFVQDTELQVKLTT